MEYQNNDTGLFPIYTTEQELRKAAIINTELICSWHVGVAAQQKTRLADITEKRI